MRRGMEGEAEEEEDEDDENEEEDEVEEEEEVEDLLGFRRTVDGGSISMKDSLVLG